MTRPNYIIVIALLFFLAFSCQPNSESTMKKQLTTTAKDILGDNNYRAISYGGYRQNSRTVQPTIEQLKNDMRILHAMGIRLLRTYNVHLPHASNVLKAIRELQNEDQSFEMYVMLGAWIDCKNAWTELPPDHNAESEQNEKEIKKAVELANAYPEIVKIIAVGNEAMVKWAAAYYVQPDVILKWVNHLQALKKSGALPKDLWITSSDNFASWGGGDKEYHVEDLNELIKAVDFLSVHTYPMHDTHYNPAFWGVKENEADLSKKEKINAAMERALEYAQSQFESVKKYVKTLGVNKPIHIGETGWASHSGGYYGANGSKACDEFKQALFHDFMRSWTDKEGISCFYFEAFDEPWKDAANPKGSENHFGLITVNGKAKYVLWDSVDKAIFNGLTRNGNKISKTFDGDFEAMMETVLVPDYKSDIKEKYQVQ